MSEQKRFTLFDNTNPKVIGNVLTVTFLERADQAHPDAEIKVEYSGPLTNGPHDELRDPFGQLGSYGYWYTDDPTFHQGSISTLRSSDGIHYSNGDEEENPRIEVKLPTKGGATLELTHIWKNSRIVAALGSERVVRLFLPERKAKP